MLQSLADELTRLIDLAAIELRTVDDALAAAKRDPHVWSVKEIVGHLIDSAANNHQRFIRAQQSGELSFPGYEQNAWVLAQNYQAESWPRLVDLLILYNRHLAHVIRQMPQSVADVPCRIGTNEAVSLSFLAEDYLTHLRHHLKQIRERRAA